MLGSLRTSFTGYLTYRGGVGQISFLLHRVTGLGVLFFLTIHIVDTALVYFAPQLYEHALELFRSTPFMVGEIGLVFCVFFHGLNGLRIAYYDLFTTAGGEIDRVRKSVWATFVITMILWIPAASIMVYKLLHYNFGFFAGK
jgi:succinate dehydrogenase / fumarate reductase, cytochrome b subunit